MKDKDLSELTGMIQQHLNNSLSKSSANSFTNFSQFLTAIKAELRESLQKLTAEIIKTVIFKLKNKKPLTDEEAQYLRLWIIGDAESYVNTENNFNDWILEAKRLAAKIQSYGSQTPDVGNMLALQSLIVDLHRNLQDIVNYLSEKERVGRFVESAGQIDSDEAAVLATLLERKLRSADM